VNRAVAQMDNVTQSTAAQTEQVSATAQSLAGQAGQLQALVGRFKLEHVAHATSATPSVPTTLLRESAPSISPSLAARRPAPALDPQGWAASLDSDFEEF